jgi:Uma2 family endonuclease
MASGQQTSSSNWTAEDLVVRFGPIPLNRIRMHPAPGTATIADVIAIETRENRLCELVDGVLVEKVMGTVESAIAIQLAAYLIAYIKPRRLGIVLGADGMLEMAPGLVRIPDVSFISATRLKDGKLPSDPIAALVPDLAVEVLSAGNTASEMTRKLREYFQYGTSLVWYVTPQNQQVAVYRSLEQQKLLVVGDVLEGDDVIPGFSLQVAELFANPLAG